MSSLILNFHGIGPTPRTIDHGEYNCWLDQDFFEAILDLVRGQPQVQLTFDDGNASDVEIALPMLLQRGLKATFFVCTGRLDQPTFLSQSQLRNLITQGMGIGSHGVNHLAWRHLSTAKLIEETTDSKNAIESLGGIEVNRAACPFGSYDRRVLTTLRTAGYRFVYTSDGGASSLEQRLQARNTVTRSTRLETIQTLIQRGPGVCIQSLINARKFLKRLR